MMNITHLASFYEVVLRGSFSAAADKLDVSKGMLSRHVSALEKALNAQLLQRTTRKLNLTEAGKTLYLQAGQIFALATQAAQDIQALTEEDHGRLRFTCPLNLGDRLVSELLERYTKLCPGVTLELNFTNTLLDLQQGDDDIALRAADQVPDNLVALQIGTLKDVIVASPERVALEGSPATPYELSGRHCLLGCHSVLTEWWFYEGEEELCIPVSGKLQSNHYSTLLELARAGMGYAKCPLILAEPWLARGDLVSVLNDWQSGERQLHILHAQQRRVPRKIQQFKQVLAEWFAEHPHYFCTRRDLMLNGKIV